MESIPSTAHTLPQTDEQADPLVLRWGALREAARAIGALAGVHSAQEIAALLAFPAGLRKVEARRARLIEQSIDDLVAVMEPGVAAVLSVHERGGDIVPAARALWQEFIAARQGLLALVPPEDDQDL